MSKKHICEICSKEFIKPKPSHPSRFCSRDCFFTWQRSDSAKEISRQKMLDRRERYEKKHGVPLGFSSINNPSKSLTAKKRLSDLRKGTKTSIKTRKKISNSLKMSLKDPLLRKKWSDVATGRKYSIETRKKISAAHNGKYQSRSGLIAKLDKIYSWYLKESRSKNGQASCVTCDRIFDAYSMDCGHYISRRFISVRFDERNTHLQCVSCNRFEQGNIDVYTLKMMRMYGPKILEELNSLKNSTTKITNVDLENKLTYYMSELTRLNPQKYPLWG